MKEQWNNNGISAKQIGALEEGNTRPILIEMHRYSVKGNRNRCCVIFQNSLRALVMLMLLFMLTWFILTLWKYFLRPVHFTDNEITDFPEITGIEKNLDHANSLTAPHTNLEVGSRSPLTTTEDNRYITSEASVEGMLSNFDEPVTDEINLGLVQSAFDFLRLNVELAGSIFGEGAVHDAVQKELNHQSNDEIEVNDRNLEKRILKEEQDELSENLGIKEDVGENNESDSKNDEMENDPENGEKKPLSEEKDIFHSNIATTQTSLQNGPITSTDGIIDTATERSNWLQESTTEDNEYEHIMEALEKIDKDKRYDDIIKVLVAQMHQIAQSHQATSNDSTELDSSALYKRLREELIKQMPIDYGDDILDQYDSMYAYM